MLGSSAEVGERNQLSFLCISNEEAVHAIAHVRVQLLNCSMFGEFYLDLFRVLSNLELRVRDPPCFLHVEILTIHHAMDVALTDQSVVVLASSVICDLLAQYYWNAATEENTDQIFFLDLFWSKSQQVLFLRQDHSPLPHN